MKIIEKAISSLIPYEFNNKVHWSEQINKIANSIKEFWFQQPIVIDKNNVIIVWHGRYEWAKKLWMEKVPCVVADELSEVQVKKYRILDNKLNESEYDVENLKLELDWLDDMNFWDLELSVEELFDDLFHDEKEKEIVDVWARIPKKAKCIQRWDLIQLWNHRLLCWDSTSEEDVWTLMWWECADIMFTSPPYNAWKDIERANAHYEKWKTIRASTTKYMNDVDEKNEQEYRDFLKAFTELALKCSQYVFVNIQSISWNKLSLIEYLYDMKDKYADTIIRDKWHGAPAIWNNVLNSTFEYIHIFSNKWNRAIWTIPFRWTLQNIIHIWKQHNNEYSEFHNATFPIEFAKHFIENFAKNSVLDLFWWTWTSMIVAEQLWKKSYLMELEPLYCEVIIDRFHKLKPNDEIKCLNRELDIEQIFEE